jgi:hypothetical protein
VASVVLRPIWGEGLLSQQTGTWRRLKQCRASTCRSAFYDRSKNNSGVWHDVKAVATPPTCERPGRGDASQ